MCTGIASEENASMMNRSKLASSSLAIVSLASPTTMSMSGWHLAMNVKFFGFLAILMTDGVDLEEPPGLALLLVAGARAGSQTDDAVVALLGAQDLAPLGDRLADRAPRVVVGGRHGVVDRACLPSTDAAPRAGWCRGPGCGRSRSAADDLHAVDAEEAPLRVGRANRRLTSEGSHTRAAHISAAATSCRGGYCTLASRTAARRMTTSGVGPTGRNELRRYALRPGPAAQMARSPRRR